MSSEVWLQVNGRRYGGWKSLTINSSINSQARAFAVSCTYDTPEGLTSARLQAGQPLQVLIGSQVVMTGYIDAAAVAYDGGRHRCVSIGFPIETLTSQQQADDLMREVVRFIFKE